MKSAAIIGVLVVLACASGGGTGNGDQSANIKHVLYGGMDIQSNAEVDASATWHDIAAPATVTWQFLPVAYSKLGLTITKYDSTSHVIEGERLRSRTDFGGKQLGSLLDCGEVAGVPNVSRYDVNIQVRTALRGSDKASGVATVVNASAKAGGYAGEAIPCLVNSGIPDRVAAMVAETVAEATK